MPQADNETTLLPGQKWAACWTTATQGPYPSGKPVAQPALSFALPSAIEGARDQTFRMICRSDAWGRHLRLRFSNAFGTRTVTIGDIHVGLQATGAMLVPGSNCALAPGRGGDLVIEPGRTATTPPMALPFVRDTDALDLVGRKLAVSFRVKGVSGPMTWHAKAMTTSYLTAPAHAPCAHLEDDAAFPYTTTSWFFLDQVHMTLPSGTPVVAAFGDSITDGTGTTLNADDRWPDFLSRRLCARPGPRPVVVNLGIGANGIINPRSYSLDAPFPGGPSALQRLERDVLSIPGLTHVIWLEGINDLGKSDIAPPVPEEPEDMIRAMREGVARMREKGVRVIGATMTSTLGAELGIYGSSEVDRRRRQINDFIRNGGLFDGVADFDAVTTHPQTGRLKAEYSPSSTLGGPGDGIHPNRAGYQAMANAIDLDLLSR